MDRRVARRRSCRRSARRAITDSIRTGTAPTRSRRRRPPATSRRPSPAPRLVAYASDVSTGRVNANSVDSDIDIQQRHIARADLLKAAADAADFAAWLAALPPKGDYPALQKVLADLRKQRASAAYTPLPTATC